MFEKLFNQSVENLTTQVEDLQTSLPKKSQTFERDSLDLTKESLPETHFQVQIDTLTKEKETLIGQLEDARAQQTEMVNSLFKKTCVKLFLLKFYFFFNFQNLYNGVRL